MDNATSATTTNASTELARERTRQAADRTLMAWVRTSLSLIGFGFGIAKYRDILMNAGFIQRPPEEFNTTLIFGLSFISLGVFGLLAAVLQHWRILEAIKGDPLAFPVFKPLSMFMAVILLLIGVFAFAAVLIH
jgi:putative membrane protein